MTTVTVIIVVLVVAALIAAAFMMYQKQRSAQLQDRFGPEYDRAVEGADSRREAESHLAGIAQQRDKLDVRDLDEAERTRFSAEWEAIQARFVDEPGRAVDAADTLISTVMRERGYPVEDFDQRADLVAADHPQVVQHYREAHAAHERHRSAGGVDTEDLRQSFVHYRALFVALVENGDGTADSPSDGVETLDRTQTPEAEPRGGEVRDVDDVREVDVRDAEAREAATRREDVDVRDADVPDAKRGEPDRVDPDRVEADKNGIHPTYPQETR